jgi:hypothetical protein
MLFLPLLALLPVMLTHACDSDKTTTTTPVSIPGASSAAPRAVSGYGDCTAPGCADIARACDDLFRMGCGTMFLGGNPAPTPGSADFQKAVGVCAGASSVELLEASEIHEEEGEGDAGESASASARLGVLGTEAAACVRRASSCNEATLCLRGVTIPPQVYPTSDAGSAPMPSAPAPPPTWKQPYVGEGPDFATTALPWADDAGTAPMELIPGVDSPSCARCTAARCPRFAYRCFAAADDPTECANGDCCHSMRQCVRACGGYARDASPATFYRCLARCEGTRPHAAQQLADLQQCAAVACTGCEKLDRTYAYDRDAGALAPASTDAEVGP